MDAVFQALNDASRRLLLDRLLDNDGQNLGQLCEHLPNMTRFGVMNHLRVLEEAGLITTHKAGRSKYHFLNPVPIHKVHERWISKYTKPWVNGLVRLETHLERGGATMSVPDHVYETHIRCDQDAAWAAITDGAQTVHYYYGTRVVSDWSPGAGIRYLSEDETVVADGEVLAIDPPHRLDMTFHPRWDHEMEAAGPVRMVWILDGGDGLTRVRVELHDLHGTTAQDFRDGLAYIVSGMKTLLETGQPIRRDVLTHEPAGAVPGHSGELVT